MLKKVYKQIINDILVVLSVILILAGIYIQVFSNSHNEIRQQPVVYQLDDYSFDYQKIEQGEGGREKEDVNLIIAEGSSTLEIAYQLEEKGLISASDFLRFVELFPIERRIKAGEYTFSKQIETGELLSEILLD